MRPPTPIRASLALALSGGVGACNGSAFTCSEDVQCQQGSDDAWCEPSGHCSFPASDCDSGRRYGEHAAPGLADQCVEPPAASSDGATDSGPVTPSTDGLDSTGPVVPTTGSADSLIFTDDEWDGEFAAGTAQELVWDGVAVRLAEGSTEGTLVSRPFDAGGPASWTSLAWSARAPYGKPLPDDGAAELGYAEDGVDMRDNLLLLHLDLGSGPLRDGAVVPDASGTEHHAVVDGEGASGGDGRFDGALEDASNSRLLVDPADFEPVEGDFSWALWVRLDEPCSGAPAMIGMDGATTPDSANMWLACLQAGSFPPCPDGSGGRAAFVVSATQQPSGGGAVCGATLIDDGQWHHVVGTKRGHVPATLRIYVDGQLDDEATVTIDGPLAFPDDVELSIGAHPGDTYQLAGSLDEVAIWSRALTEQEVGAMYRRGVLRLDLDVRTCDDSGCATPSPFTGPGGDSEPFVDPAAALEPGTTQPLTLDGPVLQYRARLWSLIPGLSPGLEAVTVTAERR